MKTFAADREYCARLLFMVFKMICHLRFLDEIRFDSNMLYDITETTLLRHVNETQDSLLICKISKIWSEIFNSQWNIFEIDNVDKLIVFAAIFAIEISNYFEKVGESSDEINMTRNKKQKLYIIYFTLVYFQTLQIEEYTGLGAILTNLHSSLKNYMEKVTINKLTIENQILILEYYFKNFATLNIRISEQDEILFERLLTNLSKIPRYKLHISFIASLILLDISDLSVENQAQYAYRFGRIKSFMRDLIMALSDEEYINKLQNEKKLFLYEDLKDNYLWIISPDLFQGVLEKCGIHLFYVNENMIPENIENEEYIIIKQIMTRIVRSFNKSMFFDKNTSESYLKMFDDSANISPPSTSYCHTYENLLDQVDSTENYGRRYLLNVMTFRELLRLFILVYEMKFMFADIDSKIDGL
ncbi:hypothetical protein RF11_07533 [Thelohanellus kitauei]|uniref:Uncharacterized protein n=1 Tax=Thelohanellus kitauei TaxID=669202 RepID=A0A0C2M4E8_THEKT|nr:hypothetical protein RF11_07533 [Thelohanellus kitauei]